jgi:hypothetical protein
MLILELKLKNNCINDYESLILKKDEYHDHKIKALKGDINSNNEELKSSILYKENEINSLKLKFEENKEKYSKQMNNKNYEIKELKSEQLKLINNNEKIVKLDNLNKLVDD